MVPIEIWEKALRAARELDGVPSAEVVVGNGLPVETVRELAVLAGVRVGKQLYCPERQLVAIESFDGTAHGVRIRGQGCRPATREDVEESSK